MPSEAQAAVDTTKGAIEAADKAIDLYNKVLDQIIPWEEFEKTIKELNRYQDQYSKESAELVGQIKTLILESQDKYFASTQVIYEWCATSSELLKAYITLFQEYDERKATAQKAILLKVLGDGIGKMTKSQDALQKSSESFNSAAGKLVALNAQLSNDFSDKSLFFQNQVDKLRKEAYGGAAGGIIAGPFGLIVSYSIAAGVVEGKLVPALKAKLDSVKTFFENLKTTITSAADEITKTKDKLKDEVSVIGTMKSQTETTQLYVEYDDMMLSLLKDAATKLIAQCAAYQKRHGKKN